VTNKYFKKPRPIKVHFAITPGQIVTIEGIVNYKKGDAIMTGIEGEQWPIAREDFTQSYDPTTPNIMGLDGYYQKKYLVVIARKVLHDEIVKHKNSVLSAKAGDYIITSPDGKEWVVANDIFQATYQLTN
jgi:hypothetical protein